MRAVSILLFFVAANAVAQPRVGLIDFYGQQKLSTDKIGKALGVGVGDALPPSKLDLEERLEELDGVVRSHVEAACCAGGKAILYAGVEERDSRHFQPRMIATGRDLTLPSGDDATALAEAVRDADDPSVRADAAALLGDAPATQASVDTLQVAAQDPDPTVRRAAVRGLVRMYRAAPQANDERVQVQPTWIIEMLNSVIWSDRVQAVDALLAMTERRDDLLISKIRTSGFDSLLQMANWKHLEHALPPYLLLCRVSGVPEKQAQASWSAGERDKVLTQIQKGSSKK